MRGRVFRVITKAKIRILSILLLVNMLIITINVMSIAAPNTIEVPRDHYTIQQAINAANLGDTIKVSAGIYQENVVVNKTLTLMGAGENASFIEGTSTKPTITVTASNVNISGFTIRGGTKGVFLFGSSMSTISNNTIISNSAQGIHLNSSHSNTLMGNTVSLNGFEGVFVQDSNSNLISHNVITKNKYVGIDLLDSNNTRISNNAITFHDDVPAHAQGVWSTSSNNNTIDLNMILNNAWGIDTDSGDNNTVYGNIISYNYHGVDVEFSNNNDFYHNNFINNTYQVESYRSSNTWDNGYPSGGNYWSDYTGVDSYSGPYQNITGPDEIGDTPYAIDENNQDGYPLMNRWRPPVKDVTPPITTDDYDGLWYNQDFVITLTAEDFSGVNVTYYRINDAPTISNVSAHGQPLITVESANNTLEYWSIDSEGNNETRHYLTDIKLDKTFPHGSILINNDDAYSTSPSVTLGLFANDTLSGILQMRFSNDELPWDPWEIYTTAKIWNLALGDGLKRVYVQYMDNAGLTSQSYNDTIILDTSPPGVLILSPREGSEVKSSDVTIHWNGTDTGSGIDYYEVRLDSGLWINVETEQNYTFTGLSDGNHTVDVKAVDKLGQSQEASVSFIVNTSLIGGPGYTEEITLGVVLAVALVIAALYVFKVRKARRARVSGVS